VSLEKAGEGVAQLRIRGKGAWTISGENRVSIVERLYKAHCQNMPVKTADLIKGIQIDGLSNAFGPEWKEIRGRFICSPRRGLWQVCT
jgi:hypothetical protein